MTEVDCGQHAVVPIEPDMDSAPWWAEVAEHRFTLPFCEEGGHFFFPPLPTCPLCGSEGVVLRDASGSGRIYSWVVIHRALDPRFADDVPYTIVAVHLDEGVRMFGRYCAVGQPQAGLRVHAVFYRVGTQHLIGFARDRI